MSRTRFPWNRLVGPIGVDLSPDAPRAMQVRHGPDAPLCATTVRVAPAATLVDRASACVQQMRRANFTGREVVVGLPSGFVRMAVTRLPQLRGPDAREAVAWEAAERCGMPREALVADALPTGAPSNSHEGKEEHLMVAAPSEELSEALGVLVDAGYEPVAVEPRFAAIARALSRRSRRDADVADVRAVLHIEQEGSVVLVLRGDRISFCREIPTGGAVLDRAVAERLSVPIESAAALRSSRLAAMRGLGNPVDTVTEEAALGATRASLDALAGEVALCLRYFGVTFRGGQPARVVLSGPHGAEPRLAGIIEESCRSTVVSCEAELPNAAGSADLGVVGVGGPTSMADWIACFGLACRSRALMLSEAAA